ncbi:MAG: rhomboid family intramembrane serine protease [Lysobacteraceae bacterium]
MFVHVPSRRRPPPPWATPLLVLACMVVWVWLATGDAGERGHFLQRWGTVPETLLAGEAEWRSLLDGRVLTLFSAIFVHADWLHLVGNLLFLMIFGIPSERALGPWRLVLLFLLCGGLANLAAAISLQNTHAAVIVGASGAISGVIGAYLALFPRAHLGFVVPLGLFLEFVRTPASLLIAIWALLQLGFTFIGPAFGAVAWWAHLTGFVLGVLMALLWRPAVARRLRS